MMIGNCLVVSGCGYYAWGQFQPDETHGNTVINTKQQNVVEDPGCVCFAQKHSLIDRLVRRLLQIRNMISLSCKPVDKNFLIRGHATDG